MFYIRLCPNTKQNKTKKHHLSKTKTITAKTAGSIRDAKIKMKFLENTIATDKRLRKSEWTYPLTFSLHFCTSWPHSPCHGPVNVLLYQQTVVINSGIKMWFFRQTEGAECLAEQNEIPVASRQQLALLKSSSDRQLSCIGLPALQHLLSSTWSLASACTSTAASISLLSGHLVSTLAFNLNSWAGNFYIPIFSLFFFLFVIVR